MLSNFHISNFRSFRELRVPRLSRVNLFVGPNNAGKTSILEAAELVAQGTIQGLGAGPRRRGERLFAATDRSERERALLDPSHLFHGHILTPQISFEKDLTQTVSYTAEELAIAARHHIEVR